MEYDLDQGFPPLSTADIFPQIKEIYSMNTYRGRSEEWAHKKMQFLVYDDTDDVKPPKKEPPTPEIDGYDSNDEESQLEYAIKLSLEDGDAEHEGTNTEQCVASATIPASKRTAAEAFAEKHPEMEEADSRRQGLSCLIEILSKVMENTKYEGSTSDHHWEECELCSPLPEFPHDRKPRKLRLFRPRDIFLQLGIPNTPVCSHYIPMSYCWPPRQKDKNGNPLPSSGSYQIREPDGTIRTNRASDEVLDRAIDIAQTCGLRMIWVDQECLPQQDSEDREIGLQAMDIVYHRAIMTAGLHSSIITSSHHIRFIRQLVRAFQDIEKENLSWEAFDKLGLQSMIPTTLDFIDKVRQEKWYKRAWIAQEALSASGHILLVFPLAPGLQLDGPEQRYRFKDSFRSPKSSLDKESRVLPTTQWSIPDSDFQSLINGIAEFYSTRNRAGLSPAFLALKQHAVPILEAAAGLWPSEKRNKRSIPIFMIGGASYGYRRRVNAAGALTVFRSRSCTRPHDRLAIMANMCGYEIRINTQAAAARGGSLRTALIALAMLNNDMSLFVPELYRSLHGRPQPFSTHPTREAIHGAELFRPFDTSADRIEYYAVDDGLRVRPKSTVHLMAHDVRRPGLNIPAYIWEVEEKMDLSIFKDQWEGHWMAIKASQHDFVDHRPGENASDSPISPKFIESNQGARRQLVEIIFGILRHMHLISGDDDRAQGVADSIWQSIRSGFVNLPLPDHVGPALFDHPHVQIYDWDILQLDHSIDEKSYSQLWFIERIMTDGSLWVGRYARFAQPRHNEEFRQILQSEEGSRAIYSKHVCEALLSSEFRNTLRTADVQRLLQSEEAREALESEKTRELLRLEDVRNALELEAICKLLHWDEAEFYEIGDLILELVEEKDLQPIQGGPPSNTQHNGATPSNMRPLDGTEQAASRRSIDTDAARSKAGMMSKSIMDRQMCYELMASMIQSASLSVISRNLASVRNDFPWLLATMTGFVWNAEVEANRIRKCVSVFDVSGPCVVATPFEADLEVLPRSRIRSLSRCWVVKHVADEEIPEGDNVASGKKPAVGIESVDIGVDAARANKATRLYRVVGKVRGLWEIMEFPSKAHYFT